MLQYLSIIIPSIGTVLMAITTAIVPLITAKATHKAKVKELQVQIYKENSLNVYNNFCYAFGEYTQIQSITNKSNFIAAISRVIPLTNLHSDEIDKLLIATTKDDLQTVIQLFPNIAKRLSRNLHYEKSKIDTK